MTSVRVRGISSTALSYLFLLRGFRVVQASGVIRERLGIPFDTSPAEVTVKDSEEPSTLVVLGKPEGVREVLDSITAELRDVVVWWGRPGLHAVVRARVSRLEEGGCILELPGGVEGVLRACHGREGDLVVVSVARPSFRRGERAVVSRELRFDGLYVSLIKGGKIEFSEFIRDPAKKAELSALAVSKLVGSGLGVRFRSNSQYADPHEVSREIDFLLGVLRDFEAKLKSGGDVGVLYEGESIALVYLTSPAKARLDELRGRVAPTAIGHHQLKYMGLDEVVDYTEYLLSNKAITRESTALLSSYLVYKQVGREFSFRQVKPDGGVVNLAPGVLEKVEVGRGGLTLVFKRVMRSSGVYDGLGVEKKPGDVDYMLVDTSSWTISHNYYRGSDYLGTYVNINTPPDVGEGVVEYLDLEVDVVVRRDGGPEVVDLDKLEEAWRSKALSDSLYKRALEEVEKVRSNPTAHVYNPWKNQQK